VRAGDNRLLCHGEREEGELEEEVDECGLIHSGGYLDDYRRMLIYRGISVLLMLLM